MLPLVYRGSFDLTSISVCSDSRSLLGDSFSVPCKEDPGGTFLYFSRLAVCSNAFWLTLKEAAFFSRPVETYLLRCPFK